MNKADTHPRGDQFGLRVHRRLQQAFGAIRMRIMTRECVIAQLLQLIDLLARGEDLKRADPDVGRSNARNNRTRQHRLTVDIFARADRRQRAGRRDSQGMHRLRHHIFSQDRTEPCFAITTT